MSMVIAARSSGAATASMATIRPPAMVKLSAMRTAFGGNDDASDRAVDDGGQDSVVRPVGEERTPPPGADPRVSRSAR